MLPVPAKQSYTSASGISGVRMSNSDCLARSVIGRVASEGGASSFRPPNSPEMMRIECKCSGLTTDVSKMAAMADRKIHYEAAFEAYLRERGIPYVAVDEAKKAIFANAKLKSFDF